MNEYLAVNDENWNLMIVPSSSPEALNTQLNQIKELFWIWSRHSKNGAGKRHSQHKPWNNSYERLNNSTPLTPLPFQALKVFEEAVTAGVLMSVHQRPDKLTLGLKGQPVWSDLKFNPVEISDVEKEDLVRAVIYKGKWWPWGIVIFIVYNFAKY